MPRTKALPFSRVRERARDPGEKQRPYRKQQQRMRDASVPSDNQQLVAGKEVAEYVRIREDRAEHERPGEDPGCGSSDARQTCPRRGRRLFRSGRQRCHE